MKNIFSLILILASIGLFFIYINPTYGGVTDSKERKDKSVKELKAERARYIEALNKSQDLDEVKQGLLTQYNSVSGAQKARLEKLLPDHIDSVRLVIDVVEIARKHGMRASNITIASSDTKNGKSSGKEDNGSIGPSDDKYKDADFTFILSGTYEQFVSFLGDLEKSLRIVDIESVSFDSDPSSPIYSFTLKVKTYLLNK